MENVPCPISDNARRLPSQPALITEERTWTYQELDAEVHSLCQFLSDAGIKENQRIAFLSPTTPATIFLFFALFRMSAIACPLSTRLPQEQITKHLEHLRASHVLEPALLPSTPRSSPIPYSIPLHNSATFLFTSGSSGKPKIACHSFANHYYNAIGAVFPLKLDPSSRWLLSLPLHHVSGIAILFRSFLRGAAVVLSNLPLVDAMIQHHISHLSCVPTQLIRLLKEPPETLEKIKHSLHCLLLGGAPLSPSLIQKAVSHSLPLFLTYGMTEMSSIITLLEQNTRAGCETPAPRKIDDFEAVCEGSGRCPRPADETIPERVGEEAGSQNASKGRFYWVPEFCNRLVNKVLPFREIKISEDHEIHVRGKTLFQGYWDGAMIKQDPKEWFATKDLGKINAQGNLEIIGRKDRQFISGGENIQPEEIEQALCALPGIRNAIVLPIPDAEFGERPVAFIDDETKSHTLDSIKQALRSHLPSFKHPVKLLPYPLDAGIKPNLSLLKDQLRN